MATGAAIIGAIAAATTAGAAVYSAHTGTEAAKSAKGQQDDVRRNALAAQEEQRKELERQEAERKAEADRVKAEETAKAEEAAATKAAEAERKRIMRRKVKTDLTNNAGGRSSDNLSSSVGA